MWKLIITQERKSEYTDGVIKENVEFESKEITDLTAFVDRLSAHEGVIKTTYKIEKAGENVE